MDENKKEKQYKTLTNSTLQRKTKEELIERIRFLEDMWLKCENQLHHIDEEWMERVCEKERQYLDSLNQKDEEWQKKYNKLKYDYDNEVPPFYTLEQLRSMTSYQIEHNWEKVKRSLDRLKQRGEME